MYITDTPYETSDASSSSPSSTVESIVADSNVCSAVVLLTIAGSRVAVSTCVGSLMLERVAGDVVPRRCFLTCGWLLRAIPLAAPGTTGALLDVAPIGRSIRLIDVCGV